ncbi:uncharacterized protein LOC116248391 [Nymphaea colorata]|nr:uncharacterized protein LOC116248391 [Nymphaea colorata]
MEEEETQHLSSGAPAPPYIVVNCKASGKVTRFAAGTEAGFAVRMINKKLDIGIAPASHIEAVKGEEEPISFGHTAVLVDYGEGWKLQTVHEDADHEIRRVGSFERRVHGGMGTSSSTIFQQKRTIATGFEFSLQYIGKVLLAFCFIFLIGGVLTFILENLPSLISSVSTSL